MQLITERIQGIQRLRLDSKKLKSGNYQVKYEVEMQGRRHRYGYILAEPKQTMEKTVAQIVQIMGRQEEHLYSIGRKKQQRVLDFEIP